MTSDPGLRFRVVDTFTDLVEELALAGPLVLGLDDLQWADPSSLLTLGVLARRLTDLPVGVIGCLRPSPRRRAGPGGRSAGGGLRHHHLLLPLGAVVLGSGLLPRAFGYCAVAFGAASIVSGLAALFSATAFSLAIILIIAESAWVLAAAAALVISPKPASGPAAASQPLPQATSSRTSASQPQ